MPSSELPEPGKEILNLEEAAAYLGVSTKTFFKVLREGEMPGRKVGREWKFSRRALEGWIGSSRSRDFLDLEDDRGVTGDEEGGQNEAAPTPRRQPAPGVHRRAGPLPVPGLEADED